MESDCLPHQILSLFPSWARDAVNFQLRIQHPVSVNDYDICAIRLIKESYNKTVGCDFAALVRTNCTRYTNAATRAEAAISRPFEEGSERGYQTQFPARLFSTSHSAAAQTITIFDIFSHFIPSGPSLKEYVAGYSCVDNWNSYKT